VSDAIVAAIKHSFLKSKKMIQIHFLNLSYSKIVGLLFCAKSNWLGGSHWL